jgi:hypothetical protein
MQARKVSLHWICCYLLFSWLLLTTSAYPGDHGGQIIDLLRVQGRLLNKWRAHGLFIDRNGRRHCYWLMVLDLSSSWLLASRWFYESLYSTVFVMVSRGGVPCKKSIRVFTFSYNPTSSEKWACGFGFFQLFPEDWVWRRNCTCLVLTGSEGLQPQTICDM